jgi:hypothetical protein
MHRDSLISALSVFVGVFATAPCSLLAADGAVYYVATDGNDLGPGTMERPFATLEKAIATVKPGETIYVRGGTYSCEQTVSFLTSGEQGKPLRVWAYGNEEPVFTVKQGRGFSVGGAYWHLRGLTISRGQTTGVQLQGAGCHHNILDHLQTHSNGNTGINLTNGAACNLILNCDSYRNFDAPTHGEDADGFGAKHDIGQGNVFIGCRAWNNADDGYDCWYAGNAVRIETCCACRNGQNLWDCQGFTGNANGFKLGQMEGAHLVIRCLAWDQPMRGFDLNGNSTGVILYNCTALRNKIDYAFTFTKGNIDKNVLRNNLSLGGEIKIDPAVDENHDSWSLGSRVQITEQDFLSLDDAVIAGPRNADGSIPDSNFLRLAPDSDAIDAGTNVGLPFVGRAPELGAFEYHWVRTGGSTLKGLHQAVRDHDAAKITELLTPNADVNEVNEKDWLGYTPLHWACYFGYADVAQVLLVCKADPNLKSDTGRTPLSIAVGMNYENIADLLRQHGAKE